MTRPLRVLMVDDNPDQAAFLAAVFNLHGFDARAFTPGLAASRGSPRTAA